MHGKNGQGARHQQPTSASLGFQCHMHIHGAISKIDVEKDIQALMEETAVSSTDNKSEFLLTDYFVSMNGRNFHSWGTLVKNGGIPLKKFF